MSGGVNLPERTARERPILFLWSTRYDVLRVRATRTGRSNRRAEAGQSNRRGAAGAPRLAIPFDAGEALMFARPRDSASARIKTPRHREIGYPPGPEGMLLYAIGDIHGRSDCLRRAHDLIDRDSAKRGGRDRALEIYVGDYIDRGPDSKGVLDLLIARSTAASVVALRGNHEIVMESFLRGQTPFDDWRRLGGLETILSYGVDARRLLKKGGVQPRDLAEKFPESHLRFISSLRSVYVVGRYCFAHAGLRPGVTFERQSTEDIAWIRDEFLTFAGNFGFIVIHGHTPVASVDFLSNRINIDTGAYISNRLSILRIDAAGVTALEPAPR